MTIVHWTSHVTSFPFPRFALRPLCRRAPTSLRNGNSISSARVSLDLRSSPASSSRRVSFPHPPKRGRLDSSWQKQGAGPELQVGRKSNGSAWRSCGNGNRLGKFGLTTPTPMPMVFLKRCQERKWQLRAATGDGIPGPRLSGASGTSKIATLLRAGRGCISAGTTGTKRHDHKGEREMSTLQEAQRALKEKRKVLGEGRVSRRRCLFTRPFGHVGRKYREARSETCRRCDICWTITANPPWWWFDLSVEEGRSTRLG